MNVLEEYLDNCDNTTINKDIYNDFKLFNYTNEKLYNKHLHFMLSNLYNIQITDVRPIRLNQNEFKTNLLNKFNNMCCITNETCLAELSGAHIVPIKDEENYDVDNGLLLSENLHRTFDKLYWSINPYTNIIETLTNINTGTISKYNNTKFNHMINNNMKKYLLNHYTRFINNKN